MFLFNKVIHSRTPKIEKETSYFLDLYRFAKEDVIKDTKKVFIKKASLTLYPESNYKKQIEKDLEIAQARLLDSIYRLDNIIQAYEQYFRNHIEQMEFFYKKPIRPQQIIESVMEEIYNPVRRKI